MTSQPQTASYEQELEEKDELISALTLQLERTVNQLDRLRRNGADRAGNPVSDGDSGQQSAVVARLSGVLDEWVDFQPADRILRIEDSVERILELLESGKFAPQRAESPSADEAPGTSQFWETAKARLLEENPPDDEGSAAHEEPATATVTFDSADAAGSTVSGQEVSVGCRAPLIDPPEPVPDAADAAALRTAVENRDVYIRYLLNRLQSIEATMTPVPWHDLAAAPQELAHRLQDLEATLREQLKQAEIANSLERAELTRERAKLAQVKQTLETQIRKLAQSHPAQKPEEKAAREDPQLDEQDRRWNRLFKR